MLKGVLEGCVLALIGRGETYGYALVGTLADCGLSDIAEGTLYPLLMRLEKKGFISSEYRASEVGPRRKYYAITAEGKAEVERFSKEFASLTQVVGRVLERSVDYEVQTTRTRSEYTAAEKRNEMGETHE